MKNKKNEFGMDKVFRTGNQWFIGVWKDSKKTQVRLN